ncbi:cathepsin L-like [Paramacrobiotus metropolitanus]|uniref:cathepsin L-like n=1 Tax=Paramacrobiotus metropolitanus TaxID=2943436 RepID=UPI0024459B7C|nr:cathepsin L-like [Paramacrobiotus metropolitanus]
MKAVQTAILTVLISVSWAVLLRDPKKLPCEEYDLFDPPTKILREANGASPPETSEDLAHQVVHQLNARTNSLFKSMVVQVKHSHKQNDGNERLTFYQVETKCRNNGKPPHTLIGCPYRQQGKVQECTATITPGTHIKDDSVACKPAHFGQILGTSSNDFDHVDWADLQQLQDLPLTGFRTPSHENFKCFKLRFGKTYATQEEHDRRFKLFQTNMKRAYLYQITEQGTGTYGPTKFSDLTVEEFRSLYTGLKPLPNWNKNLRAAQIPDNANALPEAFDWRNKSAVTPVKDQGQCGSCWAFSTTGNIEGQWAIKKGKLISLSEQELVDCDKVDQGCGGGLPSNAYKAIIDIGGLENEADYPYDGRNDKCTFKKEKVIVYINDSVEISQDETEMAQWLVDNGPISIGINANAMMLYMGGISHPWKVVCSPKNLDHGVLIVGYGKDGKNPYWIVKNSWGPHWGVKGYYLVYRGDGTCGLNQMCTSAVVK